MTWWTWCFLAGAAFAAGLLNAVAGGGSFLTFPALVLAGVPPIPANATSAVALSPGYLGSVAGFRAELRTLPRSRLAGQALASGLGGVIGALLLLATPTRLFTRVVPWLVLFATGTVRRRSPPGAAPADRRRGPPLGPGPGHPAHRRLRGLFQRRPGLPAAGPLRPGRGNRPEPRQRPQEPQFPGALLDLGGGLHLRRRRALAPGPGDDGRGGRRRLLRRAPGPAPTGGPGPRRHCGHRPGDGSDPVPEVAAPPACG